MRALKYMVAALLGLGTAVSGWACSRVVYLGDSTRSEIVMVGRTLDWANPIPTNIYVYPRGVERQSNADGPMLRWKSKYGSVSAVGYDGGVTEGMNERGLVLNGLFCNETVYKTPVKGDTKTPVMSMAMIVPFFIDNFATVDEVDRWLRNNTFAISGQTFDGGRVSTLHFEFTDAAGESLIMEYVSGQLLTYRGRDLLVLTNDPTYPEMKAIEKYWQRVGGRNMLPGTVSSPDRFVRGSYFINHVPKNGDANQAWAELVSIMNNVSVPLGYEVEGAPNLSSTQWRSVADLGGLKYYMRFADTKFDFWVDLNKVRLEPGAPVLKLDTSKRSGYIGDVTGLLLPSKPFTPMY